MSEPSTSEKFKCSICPQLFEFKSQQILHESSHKKKTTCQVCSKKVFKDNFEEHMEIHLRKKAYVCDFCGTRHGTRHCLIRHLRRHLKYKTFVCDQCDKGYNEKRHYKNHLLTHIDIRPFKCDLCPKSYKRREIIEYHMIGHHQTERKQKCTLCDYESFRMSLVRKHRKLVHMKNFTCKICKKEFKQPGELRVHHEAVHVNSLHFQCTICFKLYTTEKYVKRHIRAIHGTDADRSSFKQLESGGGSKNETDGRKTWRMRKANNMNADKKVIDKPKSSSKRIRKLFKDGNRNTQRFSPKPLKYQCTLCNQLFKNEKYVKKHLQRVHSGDLTKFKKLDLESKEVMSCNDLGSEENSLESNFNDPLADVKHEPILEIVDDQNSLKAAENSTIDPLEIKLEPEELQTAASNSSGKSTHHSYSDSSQSSETTSKASNITTNSKQSLETSETSSNILENMKSEPDPLETSRDSVNSSSTVKKIVKFVRLKQSQIEMIRNSVKSSKVNKRSSDSSLPNTAKPKKIEIQECIQDPAIKLEPQETSLKISEIHQNVDPLKIIKAEPDPLEVKTEPDSQASTATTIRKLLSNIQKEPKMSFSSLRYRLNCPTCFLQFNDQQSLIVHQMKHQKIEYDERSFQCDMCGKKYNEKFSLEVHINVRHVTVKKFDCPHCDFKTTKYHLHRSHKLKHQLKTFKCEKCEKSFFSERQLIDHIEAVHPKDFSCNTCGKNFKTLVYLMRHKKTAHSVAKLKCKYCEKFFDTRDELNEHIGNLWKINKCSSHYESLSVSQ